MTSDKRTDKRTFKDFFNRRRDPKDVSRENFQGEFGGMDSFIERENMAALDGRWMSGLRGRKASDAGSQDSSRKGSDASAQGGSRKGSKHFDMTEVPEEINTV